VVKPPHACLNGEVGKQLESFIQVKKLGGDWGQRKKLKLIRRKVQCLLFPKVNMHRKKGKTLWEAVEKLSSPRSPARKIRWVKGWGWEGVWFTK